MIRVVIDTNVLVSGLLTPGGNEGLFVQAVADEWIRACISNAIMDEYALVLSRPKFGFPTADVEAVLAMLRNKGELLHPAAASATSPDPTDTKFLHCALAAQADFLVTGNRRHFPQGVYGRTQIVSARQLLQQLALKT